METGLLNSCCNKMLTTCDLPTRDIRPQADGRFGQGSAIFSCRQVPVVNSSAIYDLSLVARYLLELQLNKLLTVYEKL